MMTHLCLLSTPVQLYISIVTLVISFNVINSLRFIPESARWLLVKNKSEQAWKELEKVAAFNRKEMPDEELEQKDVNEVQRTGDFRDLFNSFNMTKRTLISCFSWQARMLTYLPVRSNLFHIFTLSKHFECSSLTLIDPVL